MCKVTVVVLIGGMLAGQYLARESLWFVPLLFVVIRPVAVLLGLPASRTTGAQRKLICWFGIRGVGSLYYLTYAIPARLEGEAAQRITALTLTTVAASIVLHGVSVTPLMRLYGREAERPIGERVDTSGT